MIISTPDLFVQPLLQFDDESGLYRHMEDYCFQYGGRDRNVYRLIVPTGRLFDGASVPIWIPPALARRDGPWLGPSAMHDETWLHCQHGGKFPPGQYQMKVADQWVDQERMSQWDSNILLAMMGVATRRISKFEAEKYRWTVQLYPPNWFKGF